ncbi:MAG: hypothetical protein ABI565_06730 [Vicinamibacteria bacterium]
MIAPDILHLVESIWEGAADRLRILALLETYGEKSYEREIPRVQLAIVKLSERQIERIPDLVAAAKVDYRDVLMWAEYPEEGRALWTVSPNLPSEQRERIDEIRRRDRAQYERWVRDARAVAQRRKAEPDER